MPQEKKKLLSYPSGKCCSQTPMIKPEPGPHDENTSNNARPGPANDATPLPGRHHHPDHQHEMVDPGDDARPSPPPPRDAAEPRPASWPVNLFSPRSCAALTLSSFSRDAATTTRRTPEEKEDDSPPHDQHHSNHPKPPPDRVEAPTRSLTNPVPTTKEAPFREAVTRTAASSSEAIQNQKMWHREPALGRPSDCRVAVSSREEEAQDGPPAPCWAAAPWQPRGSTTLAEPPPGGRHLAESRHGRPSYPPPPYHPLPPPHLATHPPPPGPAVPYPEYHTSGPLGSSSLMMYPPPPSHHHLRPLHHPSLLGRSHSLRRSNGRLPASHPGTTPLLHQPYGRLEQQQQHHVPLDFQPPSAYLPWRTTPALHTLTPSDPPAGTGRMVIRPPALPPSAAPPGAVGSGFFPRHHLHHHGTSLVKVEPTQPEARSDLAGTHRVAATAALDNHHPMTRPPRLSHEPNVGDTQHALVTPTPHKKARLSVASISTTSSSGSSSSSSLPRPSSSLSPSPLSSSTGVAHAPATGSHDSSQFQISRPPSTDPLYNRKKKSLGLLAQSFVNVFMPTRPRTEVVIDLMAQELGVERRRIYDVVNILESIQMVVKKGKNTYCWMGTAHLSNIFAILQHEGIFYDDAHLEDALESGVLTSRPPASEIAHIRGKIGHRTTGMDHNSNKSLYRLSEMFLQVFLIGHKTLSLPKASDKINGRESSLEDLAALGCRKNQEGIPTDPRLLQQAAARGLKTKIRRLYDIANVFMSVGLLAKADDTDIHQSRRPHFTWSYRMTPQEIRKHYHLMPEGMREERNPFRSSIPGVSCAWGPSAGNGLIQPSAPPPRTPASPVRLLNQSSDLSHLAAAGPSRSTARGHQDHLLLANIHQTGAAELGGEALADTDEPMRRISLSQSSA